MPSRMSAEPPKAVECTRRRELEELLRAEALPFEVLRQRLGVRVQDLEEDLRHISRSARHRGEKFEVTPPECIDCGFVFSRRLARPERMKLSRPGRCPECRSRRVSQALLHLRGAPEG